MSRTKEIIHGRIYDWDPVVLVTYFIPSEMNKPYLERQRLVLTVNRDDPFFVDKRSRIWYKIEAQVKDPTSKRPYKVEAIWKPTTASFFTKNNFVNNYDDHNWWSAILNQNKARDPDEILATLALAKTKFKQLCGARPDTRLRVNIQGFVVRPDGGYTTHRATHALINANHAKAAGKRILRALWKRVQKKQQENALAPGGSTARAAIARATRRAIS
jgi:hypothetical protein